MEHEKTIILEDAQKLMQHAQANAAGVADEANRRLAREEIEQLRVQSIAEKLVSDSQQKADKKRKLNAERWLMLQAGKEREKPENRQREKIRSSAVNSKLPDSRLAV
eukprot:2173156-Pyramimonas_sp.AAC.1